MVDALAVSPGGLPELVSYLLLPSITRSIFKLLENLIIKPLYFIIIVIIVVAIILLLLLAFLPVVW